MTNWEKLIEERYAKKNKISVSTLYEMIDLELESAFQDGVIQGHPGKRLSTKGKKKAGGDPFDQDPPKERSKSAPAGFGVLEEEFELEEVAFSAKNFPADGNQGFPGAGERSQHASKDAEYPTNRDTILVGTNGATVSVPQGTAVKFTAPYKLVRGSDLGLQKAAKGIFAAAEVSGKKGYIPITHVEKPSGGGQSRVAAGSSAQDAVMDIVALRGQEKGISVEKISSAPPGSTKPDLEVNYGGKRIQFEIKGRNSKSGFLTFFDKSAKRGKATPAILNAVLEGYLQGLTVEYEIEGSKKSQNLASALSSTGFDSSLEGIIDFFQKHVNPAIGLCGDQPPVPKSGRLPPQFVTTDQSLLSIIRENVIEHLAESGDDYFVVYTRGTEEADIYSTGGNNPLKAIEVPQFQKAGLMTYGGCSGGATRVGFKAMLAPVESNLPDPPEQN